MRNSVNAPHKTVVIILILSIFPTISYAAGWGVSGFMGAGNFRFTSKPYLFPEKKTSGLVENKGGGFAFDSNLSGNQLWNVRLNLTIEKTTLSSKEFEGSESLVGFNFDAAPGLGIVKSPGFRIWTGPELRLGIADGHGKDFTRNSSSRVAGFGVKIGANIITDNHFSLSLTSGARYELYNEAGQFGAATSIKGRTAYAYVMATFFFIAADGIEEDLHHAN